MGGWQALNYSQPHERDWTGCYGGHHQAVSRTGLRHVSASCEEWVMWGQRCKPVGRQVPGANLDTESALGHVLRDSQCRKQRALETRPHKPGTEPPTCNTPPSSWGFRPALLSLQHFSSAVKPAKLLVKWPLVEAC